ncbi:MAG: Mrp/NBP35 family ATP-binding protein [Saprospiraceae bacterium]|nr:Mrp/NBP35 family ATP-binding protein [Saprospiraceae bacterium]
MNDFIEQLSAVLAQVIEPESGKDIIHLKMVRDIQLDASNSIQMKLYLPGNNYTHKDKLYSDIHSKVMAFAPEKSIHVHFVNQMSYAEAPNTTVPHINHIIAVASGKGGVGKSTVSVSLALALKALGFRVGLLDADLYGPSIPTMLGIQSLKPMVSNDQSKPKLIPIDVQGLHVVSIGNIIEPEQAVVLRGPRLAAIIKQFFNDTAWPALDYLIVDLPPGTGDIQLTLVQTIPLTGAVMVTTPQEVSYIDALKAANMFRLEQIAVPILGIIENMAWFEPEDAPGKKYFIFGEGAGEKLAIKTQSSLLGQIPIKEKLRILLDKGEAFSIDPEYLAIVSSIVSKLLKKITLRDLILSPTQVIQATP